MATSAVRHSVLKVESCALFFGGGVFCFLAVLYLASSRVAAAWSWSKGCMMNVESVENACTKHLTTL